MILGGGRRSPTPLRPPRRLVLWTPTVQQTGNATGSRTRGSYNNWHQETDSTASKQEGGSLIVLGNQAGDSGDFIPGFHEGDIVGEVASGRLSITLDIIRSVRRTLATCVVNDPCVP